MATPKPQIRNLFATPICVHFLPVATEANAELRPLVLEKASADGGGNGGHGWRSQPDFESWGGLHNETLMRVARELADSMTATRAGGRVNVEWKVTSVAAVREHGDSQATSARHGAFWSGIYYVDDGYQKSDDEALGGQCELFDPRGALPAMVSPGLAFRIPGGLTAGHAETIRPQSGMIILHPSWLARGENRFGGQGQRITIEFDLAAPPNGAS